MKNKTNITINVYVCNIYIFSSLANTTIRLDDYTIYMYIYSRYTFLHNLQLVYQVYYKYIKVILSLINKKIIADLFIRTYRYYRFQSPEILFDPLLFNIESEHGGIHNLIHRACLACDYREQKNMYNNIILSGGNSMFELLPIRLEKMIADLVSSTTKIQIKADPERKFSTWLGGAVLASMPSYQQMWISKDAYEEHGFAAILDKCFI